MLDKVRQRPPAQHLERRDPPTRSAAPPSKQIVPPHLRLIGLRQESDGGSIKLRHQDRHSDPLTIEAFVNQPDQILEIPVIASSQKGTQPMPQGRAPLLSLNRCS